MNGANARRKFAVDVLLERGFVNCQHLAVVYLAEGEKEGTGVREWNGEKGGFKLFY